MKNIYPLVAACVLPQKLPSEERDPSRLLCVHRTHSFQIIDKHASLYLAEMLGLQTALSSNLSSNLERLVCSGFPLSNSSLKELQN